jgi:hypothetical protein
LLKRHFASLALDESIKKEAASRLFSANLDSAIATTSDAATREKALRYSLTQQRYKNL